MIQNFQKSNINFLDNKSLMEKNEINKINKQNQILMKNNPIVRCYIDKYLHNKLNNKKRRVFFMRKKCHLTLKI